MWQTGKEAGTSRQAKNSLPDKAMEVVTCRLALVRADSDRNCIVPHPNYNTNARQEHYLIGSSSKSNPRPRQKNKSTGVTNLERGSRDRVKKASNVRTSSRENTPHTFRREILQKGRGGKKLSIEENV